KLRRSESLLSTFFEHVPAMVYVKDLNGRYIFGNNRHAQAVRKTKNEILGLTDFDLDFFPHESAEECKDLDRVLLQTGKPIECSGHQRTGQRDFYCHTVKFILPDGHGKPYAICGIT